MATNYEGLPGVSGRTVATARSRQFENLVYEVAGALGAGDPERAPPRWWQRVLPILVALNAFALGVQYEHTMRLRNLIAAARDTQGQVDANLAASRELLERAASLRCQSYGFLEQDDAAQVSRL